MWLDIKDSFIMISVSKHHGCSENSVPTPCRGWRFQPDGDQFLHIILKVTQCVGDTNNQLNIR